MSNNYIPKILAQEKLEYVFENPEHGRLCHKEGDNFKNKQACQTLLYHPYIHTLSDIAIYCLIICY